MPFGILATFAAYFLWGLFPFYFHALQGIGALEMSKVTASMEK